MHNVNFYFLAKETKFLFNLVRTKWKTAPGTNCVHKMTFHLNSVHRFSYFLGFMLKITAFSR